jgi:hypothetical protein
MINVICTVCRHLLIRSASQCTRQSLNPMLRWITCIILFCFQFKIQILTHARVKLSYYRFNTHDVVGRISRNRADFDMAATTASNRLSRPEFQHSSPTFRQGILATVVGTSSWTASPAMRNASMDDTDVAAVATFFFFTDGKTFVPPFNCYIRNTSQYQMTR